jgi:hypothetical protein
MSSSSRDFPSQEKASHQLMRHEGIGIEEENRRLLKVGDITPPSSLAIVDLNRCAPTFVTIVPLNELLSRRGPVDRKTFLSPMRSWKK